jgi:hypothetical protein
LLDAIQPSDRPVFNFENRLLAYPPAVFFAVPVERGVQCHSVKPGGFAGTALKPRQGSPNLEQDFLDQVLAIFGCECVGAGHLQDGAAVRIEPAHKKRFWVLIKQFSTSLPEVLVALSGCFLQEYGAVLVQT